MVSLVKTKPLPECHHKAFFAGNNSKALSHSKQAVFKKANSLFICRMCVISMKARLVTDSISIEAFSWLPTCQALVM